MRCLNAGALAVEEHIARIGYPGKVTHKNAQLRIAYDIDRSASVRLVILHDQADGDVQQSPALAGVMSDRNVVTDVREYTGSPWQALNQAAQAAQEDYIVFMSSRIAMQGGGWLDEMQMYAQRSDGGAVSAMIVNPRGEVLVNMGSRVGMACAEFDPHEKYYKPAGFGNPLAAHYEYIEKGRRPWKYRPAGSAIVEPDDHMSYPRICAHRSVWTRTATLAVLR